MSVICAVLLILLALAGIVLLCLSVVWVEKRYPVEAYDERQKAARGRGYRLSTITGLVYYTCVAFVLIFQVDGEKTIEPFLLVVMGIILQGLVLHTYSVLCHAALPLSGKPMAAILGSLFCSTVQLAAFYNHSRQFSLDLVGHGTSAWIFLIAGISFFYLALLYIIQHLRDRKE